MRALLLRTAALGGLSAAAWLLSGTTASASPEEPPAAEITTEAAAQAPQLLDDPAGWAEAFTASVLEKHQPETFVPPPPVLTEPEEEPQEEPDESPILDFTGGSTSNSRSGTISNEAPPEVIEAKAKVRAAKIAARLAAALPPPPPPPPPAPVLVVKKAVQLLPDLPVPAPVKTEPAPANDYNWSVPGPDAPLPAPQQAPVVATAFASSGHTDNSGGTRGVLAVLTSHNSLFPPATWSVEERRDGTAPGSIPGLPSTSPD
ncbi:hypothetical protein AB0M48_09410 [Lentzea sp. NPDC051208]|uniref:hypothetical protein n=1 Tax=Lentzea sp. NPDC051208 TaxID=3154642 RepID=UPI0034412CDF